jgi:chromosome segregation ATPase
MNQEPEEESMELKIGEMKKQFQKSYDIFMKANEELSKLSFDYLTSIKDNETFSSNFDKISDVDVHDILNAPTIDDSIEKLRSKIHGDDEKFKNTFPDVAKLLKIMNNLQTDIESLRTKQDNFVKLTNEVNDEMNRFEKQIENISSDLDDLTIASSHNEGNDDYDDDDGYNFDDSEECSDSD